MARLPQPGGDSGNWGTILNDYLAQAHDSDGTLKDSSVTATVLAPNSVTSAAIVSGAVTTVHLGPAAVDTSKIEDGAITEVLLDASLQTKVNTTTPDATTTTAGKVRLAGDLGGTATAPTVPGLAQKVAKGELVFNALDYGVMGDGTTDDGPAINNCLTAARAAGAAVFLPKGTYRIRTMINVGGSNSHIYGAGMGQTILTAFGETTAKSTIVGNYGALNDVKIHDLSFVGTIVDDVTGPRRSRTSTSPGFESAIKLTGDLAPDWATVARNVTIERVEVKGAAGLPIWLSGIRGDARIQNSRFELTMDVGWTWCERYICTGNTSIKSADNGFSISRGCGSGVITGNVVEDCAYFGIWVAGFWVTGAATDRGPTRFAATGNTVRNAGKGGIILDDAPKTGTVSGNTIESVLWGPSDEPTNIFGVGIYIGGFPSNNRTGITSYAENINVTGNTLVDCARGGVLVGGAKHVNILSNLIIRPGSQYKADGTTAILSSDTDNNFGVSVLVGAQATVTNLTILSNVIIDDRGTAYTNYAWYTTGSNAPLVAGNREVGTRQSGALIHDNQVTVSHSGTHSFTGNAKFPGGATAGANALTGTISGFDINGQAGSTRLLAGVLTAGSRRWVLRGNSTAESGSNAGTGLQIDAYDDAGALLKTMLSLTRDGKIGFNGATPVAQPALGSAATDAATTQALVNNIRSALIALGLGIT